METGVAIHEGQTTTLNIEFQAGVEVTMYVVDAAGSPVYEPEVEVRDARGLVVRGSWFGGMTVRQDVIKQYLLPGVYTLLVEKDGYRPTEMVLDLTGMEGEYRGEVVLQPEG
jgi:hypothetical protein